jgi:hypothetical protein
MAGLSFRLIALIEFFTKNTEDREQKFEQHILMKKRPRFGSYIKGESTIRAGFNLIYRAIPKFCPDPRRPHLHFGNL